MSIPKMMKAAVVEKFREPFRFEKYPFPRLSQAKSW